MQRISCPCRAFTRCKECTSCFIDWSHWIFTAANRHYYVWGILLCQNGNIGGNGKLRPYSERVVLCRDLTNPWESLGNMVVRVTGGPCMQTSCSAQVTPHSGLSCWNVIMDQLNVLKGLKSQAKELAYSLVANEGWLKTLEQAYYLKNKASNSHTSWWTSGHIPGVTQVGMAVKTEFLTYPSQVEVEVRASCPRTHLEICTMIFTLPQMPCVNNLKFHKTVLELLQAFQKD